MMATAVEAPMTATATATESYSYTVDGRLVFILRRRDGPQSLHELGHVYA